MLLNDTKSIYVPHIYVCVCICRNMKENVNYSGYGVNFLSLLFPFLG